MDAIPVPEPEDIPVVNTASLPLPSIKKQKMMSSASSRPINVPDATVFSAGSYSQQYKTFSVSTKFMPVHFVTMWKDSNHRSHIAVAIWLPGSFLRGSLDGKVFPRISDCGTELIVKCNWTSLLTNMKIMEKGWNREEGVSDRQLNNMPQAAEEEVSQVREFLGVEPHEPIYSEANIKLNIECETDIKTLVPFNGKDGNTVLYVVCKVRHKSAVKPNQSMKLRPVCDFTDDSSIDSTSSSETEGVLKLSSSSHKSSRTKKTPKRFDD